MLAPADAQAPAIIDSSHGWSIARMVSSVTPRPSSKPTLTASLSPACSLARKNRAGQHRLGLVIERAYQLRLPAVPHAWTDAANVGRGQDRQKLHLLDRLNDGGEIFDGLAVRQVARLGDRRHHQMLLDQPRPQL